ncbi:hypothetical protein BJX64DRAFT_267849 [Aspergillus heterothallicus]
MAYCVIQSKYYYVSNKTRGRGTVPRSRHQESRRQCRLLTLEDEQVLSIEYNASRLEHGSGHTVWCADHILMPADQDLSRAWPLQARRSLEKEKENPGQPSPSPSPSHSPITVGKSNMHITGQDISNGCCGANSNFAQPRRSSAYRMHTCVHPIRTTSFSQSVSPG